MKLSKRVILSGITALILLAIIGSLGYFFPAAAQGTGHQGQVDSQVLESLQGGKSADFVIVMAEQADLSAAYGITDWDERGWYVYNTLRETAARSQQRSIEQLKRHGVRYESYFAGNEIYVHGGSLQALNAVMDLGDVGHVRAPVTVQLEPAGSRFFRPIGPAAPKVEQQAELQSTVDWGIDDTGAPNFWSAFGRQGEGIIVANIDSGVQYDHSALKDAYRCAGGSQPAAACWMDATNPATTVPYDDNGHGTHTMGTMVGSNDPSLLHTVGMAPGAQWIACKAFGSNGEAGDQELGNCADWILAPNGNASNRPHIVNNSWGGGQGDPWFRAKVQAWKAAGIFIVFSAGNSGGCSTVSTPGDYPESFTVAAHDSSRNIAGFSSKGPLTYYYYEAIPYLKPNISAPGVSIYSSVPGNGWATNQGTSMAAPHVAGAVALLWSCNPGLVGRINETAELLENSAEKSSNLDWCGSPETGNGNFTYGYGYLDVYRAGWNTCDNVLKSYLPLISKLNDPSVPPDPLKNGDFELGDFSWIESSSNNFELIMKSSEGIPVHDGHWGVWLGGADDEISSISQTVTIPAGRSILHYWFGSLSNDYVCRGDVFEVIVNDSDVHFSETECASLSTGHWVERTVDLSAYAGTTATIEFYLSTNANYVSSVFLDDISLETSASLSSTSSSAAGSSIDIGLSKANPQP